MTNIMVFLSFEDKKVNFVEGGVTEFELFATLVKLDLQVFLVSILYSREVSFVRVVVEEKLGEVLEHDGDALVNLQVVHESIHFEKAIDVPLVVKFLLLAQVVNIEGG